MRVTLAGFLSGTPYHRGAYPFTLLAQDTAGVTGTKACSMVVNAPGPPGLMALASGIAAGSFRYGTETEDGVIPVTLELAESLPYDVTGRMSMMHAAADQVRSDESIRFTNGGHDVDFVIPAGETKARFINDELGVRLGDRTGDVILSAVIESANAHTVIDANGTEIVPKSQQQ